VQKRWRGGEGGGIWGGRGGVGNAGGGGGTGWCEGGSWDGEALGGCGGQPGGCEGGEAQQIWGVAKGGEAVRERRNVGGGEDGWAGVLVAGEDEGANGWGRAWGVGKDGGGGREEE